MITNGIINLPSSQLLYLITGYFVGTGHLALLPAALFGALGNTVGNVVTFFLIRKYGKSLAQKILFLEKEQFEKIYHGLHETFSRKGMWYIFFGKLIPSIKAFIPMLAGLAKTPPTLTGFIFFASSFIWALGIIMIGREFGEHVSLSSMAGISFIIGVTILFFVYRSVNKTLTK